MYVFGGWDGQATHNTLHRLNTKTLKWEEMKSSEGGEVPMSMSGCGLVAKGTDELVLFGGYGLPSASATPKMKGKAVLLKTTASMRRESSLSVGLKRLQSQTRVGGEVRNGEGRESRGGVSGGSRKGDGEENRREDKDGGERDGGGGGKEVEAAEAFNAGGNGETPIVCDELSGDSLSANGFPIAEMMINRELSSSSDKSLNAFELAINEKMSHENLMNGDEKLTNGNENVMNGDENLTNGNENVMNGNENVTNGDANVTNGDENVTNGVENVTNDLNSSRVRLLSDPELIGGERKSDDEVLPGVTSKSGDAGTDITSEEKMMNGIEPTEEERRVDETLTIVGEVLTVMGSREEKMEEDKAVVINKQWTNQLYIYSVRTGQ